MLKLVSKFSLSLKSWYSGSLSCLYLLMPTVCTIFWSNLVFFLVFAPIPPMLMPRITFAHGTSPFTSDQLKLGRAGEPKGWNGHGGLKVLCSLCLALFVFTIAHFVFSRWSQGTLFTLSDTLCLHQQDALFNYRQKDLFLHCWRVGLIEQGATDLLDQVDFLFIVILWSLDSAHHYKQKTI